MAARVIILHDEIKAGARKDEEDVLHQEQFVRAELLRLGYEVETLTVSLNLDELSSTLTKLRPELVFNLVESLSGKGRLIHLVPSLLDTLGIPYTGASAEALFTTSNKPLAKSILSLSGIATPRWITAQGREEFIPGYYIIKSVWEHASLGLDETAIVEANDRESLLKAINRRQQATGDEYYAESFISGREFNIPLLPSEAGPEILPPSEIEFHEYPPDKFRIVDYQAKWEEESFEYQHTHRTFHFPPGDQPLLEELKIIAGQCWSLFGLRGFARVDCRVDAEGRPWVLEVNANPCITPDGGYLASLAEAGMEFSFALKRLIDEALRQKN